MIDEFQDITQTRLDSIFTLRSIYPDVKIFTIGDKNQSIYGFDKKIPGIPESTSPDYYYSQLVKGIKPHEYTMKTNYRSYQKILDAASVYLKNRDEAPISSKSIMLHEPNNYVKIVQWQKGMKYWTEELPELIREAQVSLKNEERHNRIEDIAVFFRSNDEVYRGYERVSKMNLQNIRLRIQGASACELYRVREIYEVLKRPAKQIADEVMEVLEQTSPELVSDISETGITLTGGCSQLYGFDALLMERTGINCTVADDPDSCTAYGCGKSLAWVNHMQEGPINIARKRMMRT